MDTIYKFICIHGHFYQPPRENPWLEEIEIEDSAYPFHDWNERVTAECYAPNAASRILGSERRIIDIVNNYSKISYNFGPTLLSWLENHNPEVYQAILQADKESQRFFSGHGTAIAQVYNHIIMPLATFRDKRTEVLWGIKDFRSRFGRMPEGMWLSETAVDNETLEILAEQGILFTILSPRQAKRIRLSGHNKWIEVKQETLDIGMPYQCNLPSGRKISIFFYDANISNEVAFQNLLENGENFARRLVNTFPENQLTPRLLSIANDGETYGHHHRFADMALAYALHEIEGKKLANITIFGEYLEKYPPTYEVVIAENTSWSCIHGMKRWEDDCGCRAMYACLISDTSVCYPAALQKRKRDYDIRPWNQKWRKPLRDAMNWLHTRLSLVFEKEMDFLFHDPWLVRDAYYDLFIRKNPETISGFFYKYAKKNPSPEEITQCLQLLEMQKNVLLMQTSCGWFFDDLAGIETVQVMMYACRAMQLAHDITGLDLESEYISLLSKAESNLSDIGNGRDIYLKYVKSAIFDINRVAFQFALTSLVKGKPDEKAISTYDIFCRSFQQEEAGTMNLATGYALFRSKITLKESNLIFVVLHMGEHNFIGGIRPFTSDNAFDEVKEDLWTSYRRGDLPGMILSIDRHFDFHSFSLWHLFSDGKRKVLSSVLEESIKDVEFVYKQLYRRYFSLATAMKELQIPPPKSIEFPIQFTLNNDLMDCISSDNYDADRIQQIITEMMRGKYEPETKGLSINAGKSIERLIQNVENNPLDISQLQKINQLFTLITPLSLSMDLHACQNTYFRIGEMMYSRMRKDMDSGQEEAKRWMVQYTELGDHLGVRCQ